MHDWRQARPGDALVTVLATEGSAPRGAGTRMAVTADAVLGTIGGGALELRAIEQARRMLAEPSGSFRVQDWPLGPLLGQCCGGRVRLLVERLADVDWFDAIEGGVHTDLSCPAISRRVEGHAARGQAISARDAIERFAEPGDEPRRPILMFGAGHVGTAIAERIGGLPLDLGWYDSRPERDRPGLVIAGEDDLVACARAAPRGTAVLILTHDHGLDYRLVAAALASDAGFVGVIGSATKRARFVSRVIGDGLDPARLTCPIGLPDVPGKQPAAIAVATLAQLLALGPC